jgi:hypothetical protein
MLKLRFLIRNETGFTVLEICLAFYNNYVHCSYLTPAPADAGGRAAKLIRYEAKLIWIKPNACNRDQ